MTYLVYAINTYGTVIPIVVTDSLDYASDMSSTWEAPPQPPSFWVTSIVGVKVDLSDEKVRELFDELNPEEDN